ncbi:STAS domain-containing protein [Actinoplanes sp. NPDC049118]|uniref:STAS domain-containing protein n=1 Tax=Actinoplanes sp. NPDC049118 TaxID=3155769 RepID=UPI0033DE68B7
MSTTFSLKAPSTQPHIDTSCPSPGTIRVAVAGEIDLSTADVLRAGLLRTLTRHVPHRIEVDLAGITFLDCSGITALIVVAEAAARIGCQLRITNPQPNVRRILDLTGLLDAVTARFDEMPLAETRTAPASLTGSTPGNPTRPNRLLVAA